jgi:hypothetical protein
MKKLKIFTAIGLLVVSAALGFAACKNTDLDAPSGFDVDLENLLTWSDVEDARSYIIEIKNVATGETTESSAKREYFSLDDLEVGDYEIRIKAIGGKDGEESKWSETYYFNRAYETGCLYRLVNNSEYEITAKGEATGVVIIEDLYRGKPVTSIAENAFRKCWDMTEIVIGNNVKTIGEGAFLHCKDLVKVTIPTSVTSIGDSAFQDCKALTTINVPESVTEISDYTFAYCKSLKSIDLHNKLLTVGEAAFLECAALETITIPDSVTTLKPDAFESANELTTVKFGSGLKTIEEYAFSNCPKLTTLIFSENSTLEKIGQRAFSGAEALETLILPKGLLDIGSSAFYGCSELDTIDLPDSLMHIRSFAFTGTKAYKESWAAGDDYIYIDDWLVDCTNEIKGYNQDNVWSDEDEVEGLTELLEDTLRNGTVGIADQVFYGAADLMRVALPASVRAVGDYAFYKCPNLRGVSSNKTKLIGKYAFSECKALTQLVLGRGLETIDNYAFFNSTGVSNNENYSIIPDTVTRIGTFAFKGTTLWNKPSEDGLVYAGNWVVGFNGANPGAVSLKKDTVGISDYAFYRCTTLQSIAGLSDVEHIGRAAFYECESLALVSLGRKLQKIEDYTFYKCSNLSNVTMLGGVKEIGRSAFYKCEWLTSISLARCDVETIGQYAFYGCTALKSVDLGSDLLTIEDKAFYKCLTLKEIKLPDSLTTLGERAFYQCAFMTKVEFGSGLDTISAYAFQGCSGLQEVVLPDTIETIEKNAFYKCSNIQTITFGAGLKAIGDYAFYGAEGLTELYIPANVTVGKYAFKGCEALTSLVLSKDVKSISDHAFYGCKQMTVYTDAVNAESAGWSDRWNSSYRPVVWGCTLSEDKTYVVSVKVTESTFGNVKAKFGFKAPEKDGQRAIGWATTEGGEIAYAIEDIATVPVGTTIYPVWGEYKPVILFVHNVEFKEYADYTLLTKAEVNAEGKYEGTALSAPAESGYVFGGYYADSKYEKAYSFEEKVITRDVIIYVKWLTPEEAESMAGDSSEENSSDDATSESASSEQ